MCCVAFFLFFFLSASSTSKDAISSSHNTRLVRRVPLEKKLEKEEYGLLSISSFFLLVFFFRSDAFRNKRPINIAHNRLHDRSRVRVKKNTGPQRTQKPLTTLWTQSKNERDRARFARVGRLGERRQWRNYWPYVSLSMCLLACLLASLVDEMRALLFVVSRRAHTISLCARRM